MAEIAINDPICIGCEADLDDDETEVEMCRACQAAIADEEGKGAICPVCTNRGCTSRECGRQIREEQRADEERDDPGAAAERRAARYDEMDREN